MTGPTGSVRATDLLALSVTVFLLWTACAPVVTQQPTAAGPQVEADAEAQVRALLQHHATLWSAGDIDRFVAGYAEDCVFISPSGLTRGRAEVHARYIKRYPDRSAMGTLTLEPQDVRVTVDGAGRGTVAVAAVWKLAFPALPDKAPISGLTLVVFHSTPSGWLIVQDASM